MKIRISFSKLLKLGGYENNSLIEVPDECTVGALLEYLGVPRIRRRSLLVYINDEPNWNSTIIKENDSVGIFTIIGGG